MVLNDTSSWDQLVWKHVDNDILSLKEEYSFKHPNQYNKPWAQIIWSNHIHPSKSVLLWRMIQNKLSTDEKMQHIRYTLVSMCSICKCHLKNIDYIFFSCPFSVKLWQWLCKILNLNNHISSSAKAIQTRSTSRSPQSSLLIKSSCIFFINSIWSDRNMAKFKEKLPQFNSACADIMAQVHLSVYNSKLTYKHSWDDF